MEKTIIHYCGFSRNYGDMAIQHSMMDMLSSVAEFKVKFIPIDLKQPTPLNADELNKMGDMLLVGGGGLIMKGDGFATESGWQFNMSLDELDKLRIPLVIYGIGYNHFPFDNEELDWSVWGHIGLTREKAALFSVREESTVKLLNSQSITNVQLIPDPAMFTQARDAAFDELKEIYDITDDMILIGVNLAGDRKELRYKDGSPIAIRLGQELCQVVAKYPNARVVYIPHVDIYDHEDKYLLKALLGDKFYDASVVTWLYPEKLTHVPSFVGLYKNMNVTVGMRGHSNILSFGQSVPYIALGNHQKNLSFVQMTGGEHVDNDCNGLADKLIKLIRFPQRDRLKRRANELYARINTFNADVIGVLKDHVNGNQG